MGLLTKNTLPAERARGCFFSENFESLAAINRNGGVVTGALEYRDRGAYFDGTNDGIDERLSGNEYDSPLISLVLEFTPYFAHDENKQRYLFDTSDATPGNNRFRVYRMDTANGNVLRIELNGTLIEAIPAATYGPVWRQNKRNVLVIAGDATNDLTSAWLNGTQILTDDTTTWASAGNAVVRQCLGTSDDGSLDFYGVLHNFKVFQCLLTEQEAIDYYANSTFNYAEKASVLLPMTMDCHDPTGVRTLDRSGHGNHATLGDGSTPTTYPTKLTGRGYSFDGVTDYLSGLPALPATYTVSILQRVDGLVSVVHEHVSTKWDQIVAAGGWTGELLYLALHPRTLTPMQKFDEQIRLLKQVNAP